MFHNIDLKVQILAAFAIIVASTAEVETFLRFALLIVSIVYTVYKIIDRFQEKAKEKKDKTYQSKKDD